MPNYQYNVTAPERWDSIANKAYGDAGRIDEIIAANPDVEITAVVPAGTALNIPIISEDEQAITNSDLPPWLR